MISDICINTRKKGILEKRDLPMLFGEVDLFPKRSCVRCCRFGGGMEMDMKKIIAALILAGMLCSMASCGRNKDQDKNSSSSSSSSSSTSQTTQNATGKFPEGMSAKSFLLTVYEAFLTEVAPAYGVNSADEVKGYFAGPETETVTEKDEDSGEEFSYELPKNEPGAVSPDDGEMLESQTLYPAASSDKLDSAAVYFNMLNQNNGTFAAFEVKNEGEMQTLADMMKTKVKNNSWICGFPERYLIMRVGDILLFSYGLDDSLTAWKNAVSSVHTDAEILYDEKLS